jgi:hypothetical protein
VRIPPLRSVAGAVWISLVTWAPAWATPSVTYDASLGTLPEAQGYTYINQAPTAPAPSVIGGVLLQGPVQDTEQQYWFRNDVPFTFARGIILEAELEIVQSGYAILQGDGSQRSGFYLEAIDSTGRRLTLGIADAGITVNTDATLQPTNGIPLFQPPLGAGFHVYTLTTDADSIYLFIDGTRRRATVLGATIFSGTQPITYFGDGTTAAGSQVEIRRVNYMYSMGTVGVEDPGDVDFGALRIVPLGALMHEGVDLAVHAGTRGPVAVKVFDVRGGMVRDLGSVATGRSGQVVHWDGTDRSGRHVAAGVYFAGASSKEQQAGCRIVLVK